MSEIAAEGYAAALRPVGARLEGLAERSDRLQADLDSRIVEQAKAAISARLGTTPDVARRSAACSTSPSTRAHAETTRFLKPAPTRFTKAKPDTIN